MLSPFMLLPSDAWAARGVLLRLAGALVLLTSLVAGFRALALDLRYAYRNAGPSVFSETDRRQMAEVRAALSPGETLLVLGTAGTVWHVRLWQRGMYPRNPVVARFEPYDQKAIRELQRRYGLRHIVLIGPPSPDPGLAARSRRELGPLAGLPDRVSMGELSP